jgi:hypothetical protein
VSSKNSQYWSAGNPRFIHELPLHDKNIGVWCPISGHRMIGSIFYDDTVHAARYMNNILCLFFAELTEEERLFCDFQQDSATAHTT